MNADSTLSHWRKSPDVSGFFLPVWKGFICTVAPAVGSWTNISTDFLLFFLLRELELSSMSGPVERQGIHIPEPERPTVVMVTTPLHTLITRLSRSCTVYPSSRAGRGGSVFRTDNTWWKGKYPLLNWPHLASDMTVAQFQAQIQTLFATYLRSSKFTR